ncbi:tRNA delta(2)-isopentenylpyrophosphate transferase [Smithella sp. SC_K08D17]|jgi:tRNA dimethylallyltransferase|nr:tRNA delta(2)-isopentenylpyrophosphate transferase [Smithella sp. D17]KIE17738.1 tRNA delta(2)-isopentenylpyrophosphate transferase [Smithella sp. SC_K08D17]
MAKNLIVILGPTASGKTHLAVRLAHDMRGEIISADSRQVYKKMDIGTGKDLDQYIINDRRIPYHLIDIIDPENEFNLFEFQNRFYEVFNNMIERGVVPVLVGGTGLYLESVLTGYNMPHAPVDKKLREDLDRKSKCELQEILQEMKPRLHNKTDIDDSERLIRAIEIERARNITDYAQQGRPDIDAIVFGIRWERSTVRQRITARLKERLNQGMIEEVRKLNAAGLTWTKLESFGLEYRFVSRYLQKLITFEEMEKKLNTAIHQFAKRQETWFRRMEKKGIVINWISGDNYTLLKESVMKYWR